MDNSFSSALISLSTANGTQSTNSPKIVDDSNLIKQILKRYHDDRDSGGHDGFYRTYFKIKLRFLWKGMKEEIYDYVHSCHVCQTMKLQQSTDHPIIPIQSSIPFHTIHIDFGELAKKSGGVKQTRSFLLLIDEADRVISGKAMKEDSRSVINFLSKDKTHSLWGNGPSPILIKLTNRMESSVIRSKRGVKTPYDSYF